MKESDWLARRSAELDAEYAKALDRVRECRAEPPARIALDHAARLAAARAGLHLYSPILRDRYMTDRNTPDARCLLCADPAAGNDVRLCDDHIDAWCDLCGYRIAAQGRLCDDCTARALEHITLD